MNDDELAPGLLVAMPSLKDSWFEKSVILLCNFTSDSAFGLVINNPSSVQVKDIIASDLAFRESLTTPLLLGGPVQQDSLWAIHSDDFKSKTTSEVAPMISISAIHEVLGAIARNEGPKKYHLGCGYAGWASGQLDHEIEKGAWWLAPVDSNLVLNLAYSQRWDSAIDTIGIDPLSGFFDSAPI